MIYLMDNGKIVLIEKKNVEFIEGKKYIGVISYEEAQHYAKPFKIPPKVLVKSINNSATRFESRENLDVLCIPLMDFKNLDGDAQSMHMFIGVDHFLVICKEDNLVKDIIKQISEDDAIDISFGRLLYDFFDKLLEKDSQYIDAFEDEVMNLEDEVIINKEQRDYVNRIVSFRKKLFTLKRYYEQLINTFNFMLVNENNLLDKPSLRLLKIHAGKLSRLHSSVLFLNEYVTQIREAYQAEVDINLNTTMKVFTVITAIFYPLTLIAGWYGMNLEMPEYGSSFSYPIVILISIFIVIFTITLFKKKKWF